MQFHASHTRLEYSLSSGKPVKMLKPLCKLVPHFDTFRSANVYRIQRRTSYYLQNIAKQLPKAPRALRLRFHGACLHPTHEKQLQALPLRYTVRAPLLVPLYRAAILCDLQTELYGRNALQRLRRVAATLAGGGMNRMSLAYNYNVPAM